MNRNQRRNQPPTYIDLKTSNSYRALIGRVPTEEQYAQFKELANELWETARLARNAWDDIQYLKNVAPSQLAYPGEREKVIADRNEDLVGYNGDLLCLRDEMNKLLFDMGLKNHTKREMLIKKIEDETR